MIDLKISHEELKTVANEKEKYEKMKEDIRMMKISDKLCQKKLKTSDKIAKMGRIKKKRFNKYKMVVITKETWEKWYRSNSS